MPLKTISGALVLAALAMSPAIAQQSISVLGTTPTADCASAADTVIATGRGSVNGIVVCDQALNWIGLTSYDRAVAHVNKGVIYQSSGQFDAALTQFDTALRIRPDFSEAMNNRGITLASLHRYTEAEASFTSALELKPEHPEKVYFNRAYTYEDEGNLKQAYFDYRRAANANPSWDQPAKELARFTVAKPALS